MKNINKYQKVVIVYFLVTIVFWAFLAFTNHKSGNLNYFYSFIFGLVPLFGGLVAMAKSTIWGGLKSALGKAVLFISLGLVLWGLGETTWSYYNFFKHVPAPYPSLADIGFASSIFFWCVGAVYLSKASGARFALKNSRFAKVFTLIAAVGLPVLAYYLLVHVARGGVLVPSGESLLKTVLDMAYPLGDFTALLLSVIIFGLSFKYFGGLIRVPIVFLLLGLGTMFVADFVFSYTTTVGTFYNGDAGDLLLSVGLFFITYGVLGFATKPKHPRVLSK